MYPAYAGFLSICHESKWVYMSADPDFLAIIGIYEKVIKSLTPSLPIVGMVVTISPSFSLYKMVVLPAASNPTIKILICFLANSRLKRDEMDSPIVAFACYACALSVVYLCFSGVTQPKKTVFIFKKSVYIFHLFLFIFGIFFSFSEEKKSR